MAELEEPGRPTSKFWAGSGRPRARLARQSPRSRTGTATTKIENEKDSTATLPRLGRCRPRELGSKVGRTGPGGRAPRVAGAPRCFVLRTNCAPDAWPARAGGRPQSLTEDEPGTTLSSLGGLFRQVRSAPTRRSGERATRTRPQETTSTTDEGRTRACRRTGPCHAGLHCDFVVFRRPETSRTTARPNEKRFAAVRPTVVARPSSSGAGVLQTLG